MDEVQEPESAAIVLDADSSQRRCIAAALDGRSFVMSGPPGTGKSQTIANIIAALMHSGRSVLFVSEKAAAIDVVGNRLRSVGLNDFVMALHSGEASRKAVAAELARAMHIGARGSAAPGHEIERTRKLREELTGYAAAMNEERSPLGRTLHDVLGRLGQLKQAVTPQVPLGLRNVAAIRALSAENCEELVQAAHSVSRAWRPAVEREAFPWRGMKKFCTPDSVLGEASEALEDLRAIVERCPFGSSVSEPHTTQAVQQMVQALETNLLQSDSVGLVSSGAESADGFSENLARLAKLFGLSKPDTIETTLGLLEFAELTCSDRRPPARWFEADGLREARRITERLSQALETLATARAAAEDLFTDQVLVSEELPAIVERFHAQHTGLIARWSHQYREDCVAVASLTHLGSWDKVVAQRLSDALSWHRAQREVSRQLMRHREVLRGFISRGEIDMPALELVLDIADRAAEFSRDESHRSLLIAQLAEDTEPDPLPGLLARGIRTDLSKWCEMSRRHVDRWLESASELVQLFDEPQRALLSSRLLGEFDQAQQLIDTLRSDRHGPEEWQTYSAGLSKLSAYGLNEIVRRAVERDVAPEQFPAVLEQAVLQCWADDLLATDTRLSVARSTDLDARVGAFQVADRRLVEAAAETVIKACMQRRPPSFFNAPANLIKRQSEQKKGHIPVRELLAQTKDFVPLIKPCFMMSPLTVSQLLPAGFHFDVVIFDEASQVRPADAVCSIYRASSLIVSGDGNQLPPTAFFESEAEGDSEAEDAESFESLLHACKAGALPVLSLEWHYRSRHEDLITFSNKAFYRNSMLTFPAALNRSDNIGVAFFRVPGVYSRGGRRDNSIEAEFVARRVIHHFDTRPDQSLAVVTLSQAQAAAVDRAVQQARSDRPDLDRCFNQDRLRGFFIKTLELVQGDERDVVILSIGYGPDEHGILSSNFGPISKEGGWRRLNVAATRARYRMEVVASFHGRSLPASGNENLQYFKRYLEYAENGPSVLELDSTPTGHARDTPFEASVLQQLRDWGYAAEPRIGVGSCQVDIGVRDPQSSGKYVLAVLCDGASYHAFKAARDRDRLREEVLAGLGWSLHRVWSSDWFRGGDSAALRLRDAVDRALARCTPQGHGEAADIFTTGG